MNINELTIGQAREIASLVGAQKADAGAWAVGANYLIRTVTHIQTGRLVSVGAQELVLEDAAWIADTGRFAGSLVDCNFLEVEPFPAGRRVFVGRGALIDAVEIDTLPRSQK